jgi:DNA-directed RNA polymerase specialized sigma24 family protein
MTTPSGTGVGGSATGGFGAAPRQEHLELVGSADNLAFLRRYLGSAHPGLSSHDAEDIAVSVLSRLMDRVQRGDWAPQSNRKMLESYLRRAADWAVLDFFRRASRAHERSLPPESMRDLALSDDETASTLEDAATATAVRGVLHRIQESGDATLFRVITYLLDVLQQTGARPSNRQVAKACGLSHTGVADALVRGRAYFEEVRNMADPDYRG